MRSARPREHDRAEEHRRRSKDFHLYKRDIRRRIAAKAIVIPTFFISKSKIVCS